MLEFANTLSQLAFLHFSFVIVRDLLATETGIRRFQKLQLGDGEETILQQFFKHCGNRAKHERLKCLIQDLFFSESSKF